MFQFPDETLMAYADGELSLEECRRLEAALATDPALRARLEPFALTGATLASVFDRPMREPVPERLLATIQAAGPRIRGAAHAARLAQQERPGVLDTIAHALFPDGLRLANAFSIAALLAVCGAAVWLVGRSGTEDGDVIAFNRGDGAASSALQAALETMPSGSPPSRNAGRADWIVPTQSFLSREQRFCRQYEMGSATGQQFIGLACRSDNAQWRVVFHAETKAREPKSGTYGTAGNSPTRDGAADPVQDALDRAVDSRIQGLVLGYEEEMTVIKNRWDAMSGRKSK
jgi:hypothetical protein